MNTQPEKAIVECPSCNFRCECTHLNGEWICATCLAEMKTATSQGGSGVIDRPHGIDRIVDKWRDRSQELLRHYAESRDWGDGAEELREIAIEKCAIDLILLDLKQWRDEQLANK